ncbi:MAG: cysteine desulfurase [Planctomycetales bacterium]|nr:cysteine desulfurase [Planctomycetales bacterium]
MAPINLDHNATTPLLPEAAEAMHAAALAYPGNPASQHELGRQARRVLEECRTRIGELLGARTGGMAADRVVFTSGGTEANNLALRGLLPAVPRGSAKSAATDGPPRVDLAVSAIEHPSVAAAATELEAAGRSVVLLPVDAEGVLRLDALAEQLAGGVRLVSVMLANNETGVLQPVVEAASQCRLHGAVIHTDAVQAVGKIPVDFAELGVDAMTVAAHKFHGPQGIGVLVVRAGVPLTPLMAGGFQQAGLRPGTESVALAVGMQTALEAWQRETEDRTRRLASIGRELQTALRGEFPDAVVVGGAAPRLPHTLCIAFAGVDRQQLAMALDLAGVACSTGSACASGSSEPSPVLLAMGLPEDVISGAIRLSWGAGTTAAEMAEATRRISLCVKQLQRR